MVAADVNKTYRDVIMGHSLKGMYGHYIKPSEEALTKAMDNYTRWIDNQIENVNQTVNKNIKDESKIDFSP